MRELPGIRVEITENEIDLPDLLTRFQNPAHGAQVIFCGTIRNVNEGKKVQAVSYDVFEPLAEKLLLEFAFQTQGDAQLLVVHRKGRVEVGEISVVVIVSSPHRKEAYEASRFLIEKIKHQAPIWKKEHYESGESEWIQGCAL